MDGQGALFFVFGELGEKRGLGLILSISYFFVCTSSHEQVVGWSVDLYDIAFVSFDLVRNWLVTNCRMVDGRTDCEKGGGEMGLAVFFFPQGRTLSG